MRYIKMLGLAAVGAMALVSLVGASSASADVLCTVNNTPECPAGKTITSITSSLKSGTKAILSGTGGETLVTCTESSVSGNIEKQGEGVEPEGSFTKENLTWGGCSTTVDTVAGGTLKIETRISKNSKNEEVHTNTVTATKAEVTVSILGVSCIYGPGAGAISLGDLTVGEPAVLDISTVVNKTGGSFICPSTAGWSANYQITNHTGVWVSQKAKD
jgi:hypothetical protein